MMKLDPEKLAGLSTFNDELNLSYGPVGSPERDGFHEDAMAWYYGELLRNRRRELKLTQRALAEKVGKKQSYIARVEKGESDIQLSSFLRIASVLGIQFVPTVI